MKIYSKHINLSYSLSIWSAFHLNGNKHAKYGSFVLQQLHTRSNMHFQVEYWRVNYFIPTMFTQKSVHFNIGRPQGTFQKLHTSYNWPLKSHIHMTQHTKSCNIHVERPALNDRPKREYFYVHPCNDLTTHCRWSIVYLLPNFLSGSLNVMGRFQILH